MSRASAPHIAGTIQLGRVTGIPIALHYSWFAIAALITIALAARLGEMPTEWSAVTRWSTALVTALLFFVTLLAHELAHAVVARARGLPIRSITLFALGGMAEIEKDATSAKTEFLVAVVGPLTSIAIGLASLALAWSSGWSAGQPPISIVGAIFGWLGSLNLMLAVVNLLPGFPLDGGRILRAGIWWMTDDADRATSAAARVGQAVASGFIAIGIYQVLTGAGFGGVWLALIGLFLLSTAHAAYDQVANTALLRTLTVDDVMDHDCATAEPGASVQSLVDDVLLRTGQRCVVVRDRERPLGLVTPRDLRRVQRARWSEVPICAVMCRLDEIEPVRPETPASEAFEQMTRQNLTLLPVMAAGQLRGVVSRETIAQLLRSRAELAA